MKESQCETEKYRDAAENIIKLGLQEMEAACALQTNDNIIAGLWMENGMGLPQTF